MHFDIFVKHMLRTIKLCSSDLETDLKFFMKIDKYISIPSLFDIIMIPASFQRGRTELHSDICLEKM